MRTMTMTRTMSLLATVVSLAAQTACTPLPARPDMVRAQIESELAAATANRQGTGAPERVPEAALLPPLTVALPVLDADDAARFDLSVVDAPAAQVFMAIVGGTRYDMLVGPEVSGKLTLNLKDVTVKEALDAIRELYGYEYTMTGRRIAIQPNTLQTRVFQVNYLAGKRQGASDLRVTSSSISANGTTPATTGTPPGGGGGGGGSAAGTGNVSSRVQTSSDTDFWGDLTRALDTVVTSEGSSRVVNSISGVVVIRALPREMRAVEQYLRATQAVVERQVMLEAKILEVELDEQYQAGINWSTFHGNRHRAGFAVAAPGSTLNARGAASEVLASSGITTTPGLAGTLASTAIGGGFVGLALQTANFAALLNFLETQGAVSVLSSPRIATLNNQKAVLKVGTDEYFITRVSGGSSTSSAAAGTTETLPNIETAPFFSGISLDVTPQIDIDGNIILHVRPAISTVEQSNKDFRLNDKNYSLPLARSSVKETDSIVRVQDGNIVAIGGMMSQRQSSDRSGLPGTLRSPAGALVGQRGSSLSKRELVILLKPTVIGDDRAWVRDLEQSGERLRGLALPPRPTATP